MTRTAQCHCGSLRATVSGEPEQVNICHCMACQRRTGSVFHCGAYYSKAAVQIEGAAKIYGRSSDSGGTVTFHFCPTCGTSLYWEPSRFPDHFVIAVGAFADPAFPAPYVSLFEATMHRWVQLPQDMQHFQGGRVGGKLTT